MNYEEIKKEYLRDPTHCIYCGSTNLEGIEPTIDPPNIYQVVMCKNCAQDWTDVYHLDGVIFELLPIEVPNA